MSDTNETLQKLAGLGYEPVGVFYCAGELVIGDPGFLNIGTGQGNPPLLRLPAHKGHWHALAKRVELEAPFFDNVIAELIVCYQGELESLPEALETLDLHGQVEAESGQVCVVDATRENEEGLDDDMMFVEADAAIVRDAGVSTTVEGDGTYPLFTDGSKPHTLISLVTWKGEPIEMEDEDGAVVDEN
jgi:hypothetical protein